MDDILFLSKILQKIWDFSISGRFLKNSNASTDSWKKFTFIF